MPDNTEAMIAYFSTQPPAQVVQGLRALKQDATDILAWADQMLGAGAEAHAIALLQDGLGELSKHPDRIAADTNLMGAWVRLFRLLSKNGRNQEAIQAYFMAESLGNGDPMDKLVLATDLHAVGRYREALKIVDGLLATKPRFDPEMMSPEHAFALAIEVKTDCLRHI